MSNPEQTEVQSPLSLTTANYITDFWNDSCSLDELKYAMSHGGVGATTNPSIVLNVLKKEMPTWRGLLNQLIEDNPTWGEEDVAWRLIEEMGLRGAELLMPIFEREGGAIALQADARIAFGSVASRIVARIWPSTLAPWTAWARSASRIRSSVTSRHMPRVPARSPRAL